MSHTTIFWDINSPVTKEGDAIDVSLIKILSETIRKRNIAI